MRKVGKGDLTGSSMTIGFGWAALGSVLLWSEAVEEWIADEERRKKSIWYGKSEP